MKLAGPASPRQKRRLLVFDFDGVICNSLEITLELMNRLAPYYGFKALKDESLLQFRSLGARQSLQQVGLSSWKVPFLVFHMRYLLRAQLDRLHPFEGIFEVLRELHQRSFEIRIFSSNSNRLVRAFMEQHEIPVDYIHGGVGLFSKPQQLKKLKRKMGQNFLYFGDEGRDLEACRVAGVTSVAVTWGYATERYLLSLGPNHLIRRPQEIRSMAESFYR